MGLAPIVATLAFEAGKFTSGLKHAEASMDSAADHAKGLHGHMGALAGAIAGVVSVAAVTAFAKTTVDAFKNVAGETMTLKRLMGGTAEEASRVRTAFELSGINADSAATAMKKFSKAIEGGSDADVKAYEALQKKYEAEKRHLEQLERLPAKTASHTQAIKDAKVALDATTAAFGDIDAGMKKYGIEITDSDGKQKSSHALLLETATRFKSMPDGIEKTALALKLFGKAGTDMLPFLNRGAEGIAELEKKSDKFGLTLSQSNLDALKKSKEAHREFEAAVKGLQVQIGAHLLPIITEFTSFLAQRVPPALKLLRDWLEENVFPTLEKFRAWLHEWLPAAMEQTLKVVSSFVDFLKKNHSVLVAFGVVLGVVLVAAAVQYTVAMLAAAAATALALLPYVLIVAAIGALVYGLIYAYKHSETFKDIVDKVADVMVNTVWPALKRVAEYIWENVVPALVEAGKWFGEHLVAAVKKVAAFVTDTLVPAFKAVWAWIRESLIPVLKELAEWFNEHVVPAVVGLTKGVMEILVPVFKLLVGFFREVVFPVVSTLVELFIEYVLPAILKVAGFVIDVLLPPFMVFVGFVKDDILPALLNIVKAMAMLVKWVAEHALAIASSFDDIVKAAKALPDKIEAAFKTLAEVIISPFREAFRGVAQSWNSTLGQIPGVGKIGGGQSTAEIIQELNNRSAAAAAGLVTGQRAAGGPVRAGGSYLVGELGPEIVTMGGNGFVTPNSGGGANVYNINVNVPVNADSGEIGRQIVSAIRMYERGNGAGWRNQVAS